MSTCRTLLLKGKRRRLLCVVCLIIIGWFTVTVAFDNFREYSNDFKLELIKRSIRSDANTGVCSIPDLPLYNPDIMRFYKKVDKLDCGNPDDDWVTCKKSICFIKPEAIAARGEISCQFTDLLRSTDFKVKYGRTRPFSKDSYVLEASDFARVVCRADSGSWSGIVIGIRDTVKVPVENSNYPLFNVFMIGFDSLSRLAFMRKLPKTYEYLTKNLTGLVLKGYNIVGDGTPQALIPILTGKTELELPETRKRKFNSEFVNVYPFIWNEYKKHGYMTAFNEDLPTTGVFTYRLNGFEKQPTDHYMRTYYLEQENYKHYKDFCISNTPSHQIFLDYSKSFLEKYSENPKFGFSFHGELSHDSINQVEVLDDDLMLWMKSLKDQHILDNTIFILMSDHGNRFADIRNTIQGKQEERLPFFSFTFPESFKKQYSKYYNNFIENIDRLTTPFDIHETLFDILRIQNLENTYKNEEELQPRALSLFRSIPKNRSCADAFIESHWCSCLDWEPINIHNERLSDESSKLFLKRLTSSIIETINNFTSPHRSLCHKLELKETVWLMKVKPKRALVQFKGSKDRDGYLADFSGSSSSSSELYQMKVKLSPGNSIYEASVTYDRKNDEFSTNVNHISRVNKYGTQMMCIYHKDPELRKFCYCKSQEDS